MRTTRVRLGLVAVAAILSFGARPSKAEDAPLSKAFPDLNFQWTVPSAEWQWEEITDADKANGFAAGARRNVGRAKEVSAFVRLGETKAFSIEYLVAEVKKSKELSFAQVTSSDMKPVSWSGVPASVVTVAGKDGSGFYAVAKTYATILGGRFYRLDIHAIGGAEQSIPEEIEAVVTGFKWLKIPEPTTAGGAGGAEAPADALVRPFPNLGLTWRLPKAGGARPLWAFTTAGKADLLPKDKGVIATAEMTAPDGTQSIDADLSIEPVPVGKLAKDFVDKAKLLPPVYGLFPAYVAPVETPNAPVGNWRGTLLAVSGNAKPQAAGSPGKPLEVRTYIVLMKGVVYQLNVLAREGAGKKFDASVQEAIQGLEWKDPFEGARGPYLWPFTPFTEPRGEYADKDIEVKITKAHGFTLTKPAGWGMLKFDGSQPEYQFVKHQTWWFVAEAREKSAYCWFAVLTFPVVDLLGQKPPKNDDTIIDDLEKSWKAAFQGSSTRLKGKDLNKIDGSFLEGKGSTYDFRGSIAGVPYYEKGWVVKNARFLYWIRTQYGGKDAETTFADPVKSLTKTFVYER